MSDEAVRGFVEASKDIYDILREGFAELERRRVVEDAQDLADGLLGPSTSEELTR